MRCSPHLSSVKMKKEKDSREIIKGGWGEGEGEGGRGCCDGGGCLCSMNRAHDRTTDGWHAWTSLGPEISANVVEESFHRELRRCRWVFRFPVFFPSRQAVFSGQDFERSLRLHRLPVEQAHSVEYTDLHLVPLLDSFIGEATRLLGYRNVL